MNDGGRTCTSRLLILSTNNGFKPFDSYYAQKTYIAKSEGLGWFYFD